MTTPEHRPTKTSAILGLFVGGVAVGLSMSATFVPFLVTAVSFSLIATGLIRQSSGWLAAGALGMIAGITFAGIAGARPWLVVVGATATLMTWDLSEHAIGLGNQLGRDAGTARNEVAHAGVTTAVAAVAIGAAMSVTALPIESLPLPALVTGMLGGIILIMALRS